MRTLEELFGVWNTLTEMASDLDESRSKVEKWQTRGSIPTAYWPRVIQEARRKGKKLTADDLLAMHSPRRAAELSAAACK